MTRLTELRRRLARLRRRRRFIRWETGYSALLLAVLWALAAAFLIDWFFEMNRPQRAVSLVLCAGVTIWAFRRYTLPWLGRNETEVDVALLVERLEHIDTDLVAAVQFESPEAVQWGSVQLEQVVIDDVAARAKKIDVMRGLSREELSRRSILLLLTLVLWIAGAIYFRNHTRAFFNRFLLGSMHYPTRTVIESITVADQEVDPARPWRTPVRVRYGAPVPFEVRCSGELPDKGKAVLTALESGLKTTLALEPVDGQPGVYAGTIGEDKGDSASRSRLTESADYQLFLGDAWTDPARLILAPLPVVEVELEVEAPPYAKASPDATPVTMPRGLQQISVIEGSRVVLRVYSDKPLKEATVSIEKQAHKLRRADPDGPDAAKSPHEQWILDEDSPLSAVTKPIWYRVQVTDTDDMQLERPIEGSIRIQTDFPPRIAAGVVTEYVLPTAKPTIYFQAIDDYALARVSVKRKVTHANGETEEKESDIYRLPSGESPKKRLQQNFPFELAPLGLKKGDRLEITLKAVDFRGSRDGKSASAEPLVFQVTDEAGIFEHMGEADRWSARQLKTMIQRQLGIGESP